MTTRAAVFHSGSAILLSIAAAKFLFHLCTAGRYGIFRDELYYLACSEHLDWGYIDQPPLIAFITWLARHLFGESLIGLRLLPALAGGATVWLEGILAKEMSGGRFAQALAALATFAVPVFLIMHHWLTMNAFEALIWMGCVWCVLRAINREQPRYWIWFGVLAAFGLENKYTTAFFIFAVAVGLLVRQERKFLDSRQLWTGAAIAFLIFLPNFIWLVRHNFTFLDLIHNIRRTNRDVVRGPFRFTAGQAMLMNPILFPLWLGGLFWLLFGAGGSRFRILGITYVVLLATFIALKRKNYYLAPIYPMLFAAGAVGFERLTIFFGPRYGLPKAISNHQNYWLWGPHNYDGSTVIVLGGDGTGDREHFRSVEVAGQAEHPYSRRDEHFDIFLCREFTGDLRKAWPTMKKWN